MHHCPELGHPILKANESLSTMSRRADRLGSLRLSQKYAVAGHGHTGRNEVGQCVDSSGKDTEGSKPRGCHGLGGQDLEGRPSLSVRGPRTRSHLLGYVATITAYSYHPLPL